MNILFEWQSFFVKNLIRRKADKVPGLLFENDLHGCSDVQGLGLSLNRRT